MRHFIFEYEWNGLLYAVTIPAATMAEAKMRAAAMERGPLTYKGELVAQIPISKDENSLWARLIKFVSGAGR